MTTKAQDQNDFALFMRIEQSSWRASSPDATPCYSLAKGEASSARRLIALGLIIPFDSIDPGATVRLKEHSTVLMSQIGERAMDHLVARLQVFPVEHALTR